MDEPLVDTAALVRWVGYAALFAVVGACTFRQLAERRIADAPLRASLARRAAGLCLLLLLAVPLSAQDVDLQWGVRIPLRDGVELNDLSRTKLAGWRAEYVGYIFQLYNLVPVLTAYENVELPLLLSLPPGVRRLPYRRRCTDRRLGGACRSTGRLYQRRLAFHRAAGWDERLCRRRGDPAPGGRWRRRNGA